MFNAPVIITNIPDIAQIYAINDRQCNDLDIAVEVMEQNLYLDTMNEDAISRWEGMLEIIPLDDDKLEDRRFRVKSKVLERLPYSIRVLRRRLDTLCPDGYVMTIDDNRIQISIQLTLKSKKMIQDVEKLLDEILPLNMYFELSILWNQWNTVKAFTYGQLSGRTWRELREEILEV